MKHLLTFTLLLLLSGCASIPLSTMMKFSGFGQEDFVALNPNEIKAKLIVDEPVHVDIEKVEMSLEITTPQQTRLFKFPLVLLDEQKIPADSGWLSSSAAKTEYTFNLADESVTNFKEVQQHINTTSDSKFGFSINTGFSELPESVNEVRLSILLQLTEDEEYVPIFEDATIDLKRNN